MIGHAQFTFLFQSTGIYSLLAGEISEIESKPKLSNCYSLQLFTI